MIKYAAKQCGLLSQALSEDQGSQKLLWPSSLDLQCCSQEHKQSFQQSRPRLQQQSAWDWTDRPWWARSRTGEGSRECSGELSGYNWRWHCPYCTSLDIELHTFYEPVKFIPFLLFFRLSVTYHSNFDALPHDHEQCSNTSRDDVSVISRQRHGNHDFTVKNLAKHFLVNIHDFQCNCLRPIHTKLHWASVVLHGNCIYKIFTWNPVLKFEVFCDNLLFCYTSRLLLSTAQLPRLTISNYLTVTS